MSAETVQYFTIFPAQSQRLMIQVPCPATESRHSMALCLSSPSLEIASLCDTLHMHATTDAKPHSCHQFMHTPLRFTGSLPLMEENSTQYLKVLGMPYLSPSAQ